MVQIVGGLGGHAREFGFILWTMWFKVEENISVFMFIKL